jgi:uncharacterized protein (TIGR01244 family)
MISFRASFLPLLALSAASALAGELPEIPHELRPSANVLIGGQPDEAALRAAAAAGIRVVVNLRTNEEAIDYDEAAVVNELGMRYLHLPVSGAADLTVENVRSFGDILEEIGDQPALLHCGSGNRVGALYALHAGTELGMAPEAAIELGQAHGLTRLEDAVRERLNGAATDLR